MKTEKILRSFGTHDGTFHADEVTACALLLLFNLIDLDKIERTRNLFTLKKCEYVCDVGGIYDSKQKLFDHHQIDYQGSLSSAGMILEYLRDQKFINHEEFDFFRQNLIAGIDAFDNGKDLSGKGVASFSHVISNFTPIPYEATHEEQNQAFKEALAFALGHLDRMYRRYHYIRSCEEIVFDCMKKSTDCLVFDKNIPWQEAFFINGGEEHPALFVIMPAGSHWKLRGIPPSKEDKMKVRVSLPEEWAGLLEQELKQVSQIPGAIFCHKERFVSIWQTKEDAIKAFSYTIQKMKKNRN